MESHISMLLRSIFIRRVRRSATRLILSWCAACFVSGCTSPGQFREPAKPTVTKAPVNFSDRTFDRANPPSDMPPLGEGEQAECDSNFRSSVNVGGNSRTVDATHAVVTITKVSMELGLDVTTWVPVDATQHVIEHEQGHRQISEYYYQSADKVAEMVAAPYLGRKVEISGSDLHAEFSKLLESMSAAITDEYGKALNTEATQLRYDAITDHARNDVGARDAVAQAIQESPGSTPSNAQTGN